jgi:hypothetical protein
MPSVYGQLTADEKNKVLEWLRVNWVTPQNCPICKDDNWFVADHVVYPMNYAGGSIVGGPAYPQVMVVSTKCGYTMYFNAAMIGIATRVITTEISAPMEFR